MTRSHHRNHHHNHHQHHHQHQYSTTSIANTTAANTTRVFAEILVGFLPVCFLYKTNPNPRKKYFLWGKVDQTPLLT